MEQQFTEIWDEIIKYAHDLYAEETYNHWIKPVTLEKIEDNKIYINVPSRLHSQKWTKDLQGKIIELAYQITGQDMIPVFNYPSQYDMNVTRAKEKKEILAPVMEQKQQAIYQNPTEVSKEKIASSNLNPKYTFDNFVKGDNTKFAYTAVITALSRFGSADTIYNPILLHGGSGLGKTHLLHASGNELLQYHPNAKVQYVTCLDFVQEYINAIKNEKNNFNVDEDLVDDFKNKYSQVDLLLVDDIQFLANKEESQNMFFHIFENIYNHNGKIIITSDKPVSEIEALTDRLVTRFNDGVTCTVEPPSYETRIAILQEKAEVFDLEMSDSCFDYIAKNLKSNVRDLEGVLSTAKLYADSIQTKVLTLDDVQKIVSNMHGDNGQLLEEITISRILKVVSKHYKIPIKELIGKKRTHDLTSKRHIAAYLCRELTDASLPAIGKEFGNRDHTTIMNSIQKVEQELEKNPDFNDELDKLRAKIQYKDV